MSILGRYIGQGGCRHRLSGALIGLSMLPLIALGLTACQGRPGLTVDQVLQRVGDIYRGMEDYHALVTVQRSDSPAEIRFHLWFSRPDLYRTEVVEPVAIAGQQTLFDGQDLWFYLPGENRVLVYRGFVGDGPEEESAFTGRLIEALLTGRETVFKGIEKLRGHPAYLLETLSPSVEGPEVVDVVRRSFWIDNEVWLPIRVEEYDVDNNLVNTVIYEGIELNPGLEARLFQPDFPPDVRTEIEQPESERLTMDQAVASAPFRLLVPAFLPEGFVLEEVRRMGGEEWAFVLRYFDGEHDLEFTENLAPEGYQTLPGGGLVAIDGTEYQVIPADDYTVIHWLEGDVEISLVGDLPRDQLLKVAAAVQPAPEAE